MSDPGYDYAVENENEVHRLREENNRLKDALAKQWAQPMITWPGADGLQNVVVFPFHMLTIVQIVGEALSLYVSEQVKKSVDFEQAIKDSPTGGL